MAKTAIIFGIRNDRSIAFAIAKKLHEQGIKIAVNYTLETKIDVLGHLEDHGILPITAMEVDVQSEEQLSLFCKRVHALTGSIDYILHAVAFGSHKMLCSKMPFSTEPVSEFIDIPLEDFQESIEISAYSLLRITRVALPYLGEHASILTTTYNASQRVVPKYGGMAIAKACLENIVKYLAHFLGEKGHRINALSPGLLMTTSAASINGVRKMRKQSAALSPLGNITLDDVAEAASYYFSDKSIRITGNIHFIDGGINIMAGE